MGWLSIFSFTVVVFIASQYSTVDAVKCCNRWFAPYGKKTINKYDCKDGCTNTDKCFKYIFDGTYCVLFTRGGARAAKGYRPLSRNKFSYCWKRSKKRCGKQGIFKKVKANEQQCSQMCDQSNDCESNYFRKDTQECLIISCGKPRGGNPKQPKATLDCTKNCASSYGGSSYKMQKKKHPPSPFGHPPAGAKPPKLAPPTPPPPNRPKNCCEDCKKLGKKCRYFVYADGQCFLYTRKDAKLKTYESCQEATGCKIRPGGQKKWVRGYIKKATWKKAETSNKECTKMCGKSENCRESLFLSEQATCIMQSVKSARSPKSLKPKGKRVEKCAPDTDCEVGPPKSCTRFG